MAPLKASGHTHRPKGEKKVADQEGDAVIKESRPVTENPGRFSHNCAPDAGSLFCLFIPPQVSGRRERIHCWEGLPHSGFVFTTERVLCQGVVILSVRSWTNVMRADSRTLGYHISLPKHLPNCEVETHFC